jgi:hypothetical protein
MGEIFVCRGGLEGVIVDVVDGSSLSFERRRAGVVVTD